MIARENVRKILICIGLALGTVLLYAPAITFNFINYDDVDYLLNNYHVKGGLNWSQLAWCFVPGYASNWHPLTWMSHMLDCQLYGLNPAGHHATSVLLHALNSMLLFLVLCRMTGSFWRCAMVAALFAWHPLHVESVAWVSERKDVLSCLFLILTVWAYVRYAEECRMQNAKCRIFYILALVLFVLGLMSKPMLVTLPFVLLLLDWWPLRRIKFGPPNLNLNPKTVPNSPDGNTAGRRKIGILLLEKAPFFLLAAVSCFLTIYAQNRGGSIQPLASDPIQSRLSNSLVAYSQYLGKAMWPDNLSIIYVLDKHLPYWQPVAAGLLLAAISALAVRRSKTRPYFLMGWLWFLGTLVPVIGLVQVGGQAIADRYTYIPSIGLFIVLCWGANDLALACRCRPLIIGALAWAVLGCCVALTSRQLQFWKDTEVLFRHAIEVTPDNCIAHATLASYYIHAGQLDKARAECDESIRIDRDYPSAYVFLGETLLRQGKLTEAATNLQTALRLAPKQQDAHYLLGQVLFAKKLPDQAAAQFEAMLNSDSGIPGVHCWLGKCLAAQGKPDEALAQFTGALRLAPEYSEARLQVAIALARQGKTTEAISHYRLAKNVPPAASDSGAMNNLAWILAASPFPELRNGAEAVKLAARACELDHHQQPMFIGTLAAAYAEAGRFDEAVAAAQQAHDLALKLAGEAHDPAEAKTAKDLAARNLELLQIYRSHHPYHEK